MSKIFFLPSHYTYVSIISNETLSANHFSVTQHSTITIFFLYNPIPLYSSPSLIFSLLPFLSPPYLRCSPAPISFLSTQSLVFLKEPRTFASHPSYSRLPFKRLHTLSVSVRRGLSLHFTLTMPSLSFHFPRLCVATTLGVTCNGAQYLLCRNSHSINGTIQVDLRK